MQYFLSANSTATRKMCLTSTYKYAYELAPVKRHCDYVTSAVVIS